MTDNQRAYEAALCVSHFDRTYIYSIRFKKDSEVMRFKEEEK